MKNYDVFINSDVPYEIRSEVSDAVTAFWDKLNSYSYGSDDWLIGIADKTGVYMEIALSGNLVVTPDYWQSLGGIEVSISYDKEPKLFWQDSCSFDFVNGKINSRITNQVLDDFKERIDNKLYDLL